MFTWTNVPTDIIKKILNLLGDGDLVDRVSRVNRTWNALALREYLRRRDIAESKGIVVGDAEAHSTFRALQGANWIKNVPTLTVYLDLNHLIFGKIYNLARFIRGLDSLGTLNFYITDPQGHRRTSWSPWFITFEDAQKLRDRWWECIRTLMNVTLSKGVEELCILEPAPRLVLTYVNLDRFSYAPALWDLRLWIKNGWTKLLSYTWPAGGENSNLIPKHSTFCLCPVCNANACGKARIKVIRLSPMLFSPVFLFDTLGILRAHASTIHTINIHEVDLGTDRRYYVTWDQLFRRLQLPLLERFTFTGPPLDKDHIRPFRIEALLSFLGRHPKITDLELVKVPTREDPVLTFTKEAPSLPNLRILIARNDLAAHILQRPGNCEHLKLLHLWSQSTPSWYPHPIFSPGPGRALAAIASNVSHPVIIGLRLKNADYCIRWMLEDAEIPRKLTQVHEIRISLGDDLKRDKNFLLDALPKWLGLFPALDEILVKVDNRYAAAVYTAINRSAFAAGPPSPSPRRPLKKVRFVL